MMRTISVGCLALAVALACGATARAEMTYALDMEGFVDHLGISHGEPQDADLWWANQFDEQPGGGLITEIGLSFGSNLTVGGPLTLAVYDDPNNDGNPDDAVLLESEEISILESDGNFDPPTFFPITPTPVSGKFFVAGLLAGVPGDASALFEADDSIVPADTDSVSQMQSWVAVDVDSPGAFDLGDVLGETSGTNDLPPTLIDDLNAPGNWVLRATAVPEPATSGLLLVASTLFASLARRRRQPVSTSA